MIAEMLKPGNYEGSAHLETPRDPEPVTYVLTITADLDKVYGRGELRHADPDFFKQAWPTIPPGTPLTLRVTDGPTLIVRLMTNTGSFYVTDGLTNDETGPKAE